MKKTLKIAFIVNDFPCISETFILNQITGLIELGHTVRIFAYKRIDGQKQHAAVIKYDLLSKARYFEPVPSGRIARLARALRVTWVYISRKLGVIFKSLSLRKYGIYEALNKYFGMEPFIEGSFDIIHCQYGTVAEDWVYLKDIIDVRIVTSFRGYDLTKYVRENSPAVYGELFKKGDMFLPVCGYFAEKLRALGCPADRIQVHFSGVDLLEFSFRERMGFDHELADNSKEIILFSIGRLVEKKGMEYLIRAVAKLVPRYPGIRCIIGGEGALRSKLENLISVLMADKNVHLRGAMTTNEVKAQLGKAHIFILASVTAEDGDQEGIPVSINEAMASGLPVIATLHSGIPELVEDGTSGFLVPERDEDAIAEKIMYFIENPGKCAEMGRRGRQIVEAKCDEGLLNAKLERLYFKALEL